MINKITLMQSYLIETLRANGISDEKILAKVRARKIEEFAQYDERFDFAGLFTLDEVGILENILENGYEIKFLTFTGLVNMLQLKFNKIENEHYKVENFTIVDLQLTKEEARTLEQMLSSNWSLSSENSSVTIKPIANPA